DPGEAAARQLFAERAQEYRRKLEQLPASLKTERDRLSQRIDELKANDAPMREVVELERERRLLPRTTGEARERWQKALDEALIRASPPVPHAEPFPGSPEASSQAMRNFLALVFCLTVGTAALPHILVRYYTTPTVREARRSVFWSLLFIFLFYLTAPAYAVFAKYEVLTHLVDSAITELPGWVAAWRRIGMITIEDINGDGILQFAELMLNPDVIVLVTPEIAGMPYVVSGLVAAGGLAAALSTADGLLLAITSALSHDIYFRLLRPRASTQWRLVISKILLLGVAVLAAAVASQRPSTILFMVAWAFSIAGSAFFPVLVLGIFWKRANRTG
ncbi:MAG TPA: VC_2705 family sodium/solute symporter, partial [Rhodocyclaceae bacterium]|nr:VC_2705 family sodium/solute symporter [Rhodocyclaceae bacterium]